MLDKGELIEFDAPRKLIKYEKGIFRGMCEMSGDLDELIEEAKKAEAKAKLIDV